jgi:hypothetical protein
MQDVARVRAASEGAAFEAALTAGEAMTLEEAVAEALPDLSEKLERSAGLSRPVESR